MIEKHIHAEKEIAYASHFYLLQTGSKQKEYETCQQLDFLQPEVRTGAFIEEKCASRPLSGGGNIGSTTLGQTD